MFSSANKTVKSAAAVQKRSAGNAFFRKAGEEGFFGAKENPAFFGKPIQAKLTVSTPDDPQEKEADAVADKVMRMTEPVAAAPLPDKKEEKIQRKEEEEVQTKVDTNPIAVQCKEEKEEKLQAKLYSVVNRMQDKHPDTKSENNHEAAGGYTISRKNNSLYHSDIMRESGRGPPVTSIPFEQTLSSSKGGGSALPSGAKNYMESRFNADFSGVRVHTDSTAISLTSNVNAKAFAHGNDIYFNSGKYSPDTAGGRTLLAHELTHTIQQGSSKSRQSLGNPTDAKTVSRKTSHASFGKIPSYCKSGLPSPVSQHHSAAIENKEGTQNAEPVNPVTKAQPTALSNLSVNAAGVIHSSSKPIVGNKAALAPVQSKILSKKEEAQTEEELSSETQHDHAPLSHQLSNTSNIAADVMRSHAGIQLKHISTPQADPAFVAETSKVKKAAQQAKKHEPAAKKVKDAQSAAKPPANEKESKAKDKKAEEMAQQEPGTFDEAKFKAALREKIAALQLNTLKEAEDFKANNKAASLKGDVSSQVSNEKEKAAGSIEGKVKEAPAPGNVQGKEVGPDPRAEKDVAVPSINGQQAAPKPVPAEDVSLQKESQSLDKQMADAKVTEGQLSKSNEPKFTGALASKKDAQKDAQQRPQDFRKDEKSIINSTQLTTSATGRAGLAAMAATHKQKAGGVLSKQQEAKAKDEADRARIAADIEAKFNTTKTDVEGILFKLDTDVAAMFDKGISDATKDFEDYIDREVHKYKVDRYLNRIGGSLLWAADLLLGMPDEVNDIYKRGKDRYVKSMDVVINKVARLVVTQLNAAKKRIAQGKQEIKSYVEKLPKNLQSIGNDAAKKVQSQFSELEQSVNNKQGELVDSLAAKYKAGLENVDKKIAEMKEANKGLIDKAVGAIKDVIDAIIEFKNMLLNVLARAAAAIELIIDDPIGFLGNLVAGVKAGIQGFVSNIGTHLKNGLMGWLFGELGKAGIQMPQSFDAKGIMSLVLQVLGLTYANIRSRAVNIVGEKVVKALETAAEVFMVIKNEGIAGLWRFIKEKVEQLKDTVIDSIKSFVTEKIIVAGVTWLISMLNPASAFIKACKMIYDVIMFFVTRGSQIMALVNAVIDSVTAIAKGAIGVAATAVENALAKALPVAISFLASLLGLDGISEKIKAIIAKIQAPINAAIDWVINKAVGLVKAAGKLLGFGKDKDKDKKSEYSPEKQAKIDAGIVFMEQEEAKYLKEGKITKEDADKVAAAVKTNHPVFTSFTSKETDTSIKFMYTASPEREARTVPKVGKISLTETEAFKGSGKLKPEWKIQTSNNLINAENKEKYQKSQKALNEFFKGSIGDGSTAFIAMIEQFLSYSGDKPIAIVQNTTHETKLRGFKNEIATIQGDLAGIKDDDKDLRAAATNKMTSLNERIETALSWIDTIKKQQPALITTATIKDQSNQETSNIFKNWLKMVPLPSWAKPYEGLFLDAGTNKGYIKGDKDRKIRLVQESISYLKQILASETSIKERLATIENLLKNFTSLSKTKRENIDRTFSQINSTLTLNKGRLDEAKTRDYADTGIDQKIVNELNDNISKVDKSIASLNQTFNQLRDNYVILKK